MADSDGPASDPDPSGPDQSHPETGVTVELALSDIRAAGALEPAEDERLRSQLPGLEPDRRADDWGRSERAQSVAERTVYRFLYDYWFRVETEGVENVPAEGGALLVANRAGPLPADAAMIVSAIRREHAAARTTHVASDRSFREVPLLGMMATKIGTIPSHPANLFRLLYDERALVLAFPEGRSGAVKPLGKRYRLRRFDPEPLRTAVRAGVSIVPVALVGAEEASPVLARVNPLRRLTRLPGLPLTPALPLPAKFRIRFLEPVATAGLEGEDAASLHALAADVRALVQENLLEMVVGRRNVWLG